MPADFGACCFQCDLRDGIMREVCLTGRYEPQETALLQQILQPGMTFVDVGANWGSSRCVRRIWSVLPVGC